VSKQRRRSTDGHGRRPSSTQHGPGLLPRITGPSHALTESLRSLYRWYVARDRRWCNHDYPGGTGTALRKAPLLVPPRARRTGFSHKVGDLALLGSGLSLWSFVYGVHGVVSPAKPSTAPAPRLSSLACAPPQAQPQPPRARPQAEIVWREYSGSVSQWIASALSAASSPTTV